MPWGVALKKVYDPWLSFTWIENGQYIINIYDKIKNKGVSIWNKQLKN